jgi:hypothetical protein
VGVEGGGPDGEGDAHVEAAASRMHAGLAVVGRNAVIAHRFDDKTLGDIMDFKTSERTEGFVRELLQTDCMSSGSLSRRRRQCGSRNAAATCLP